MLNNSKTAAQGDMENLITVLIPVYNEEEVLEICFERVSKVMSNLDYSFEVLFINDGSTDLSWDVIKQLKMKHANIRAIDLSRNFGKEHAMTAGLEYAKGEAIIILDADLQDPPELIPQFIEKWKQGFDNVYGRRVSRDGETWVKRSTASMFYKLLHKVSKVNVPKNTGDFRLLSRRAVDSLLELKEQHRFMKGLFAWVGYPSFEIKYHREPRAAGVTSFNYWKLWNFALEGITSFTSAPLKIATYIGLFTSFFSFSYGLLIIFKTLAFGEPVSGYPSLMTVILFLGGVQLLFIGILGEYLGRVFEEVKRRPLYIVQEYLDSE